MEIFIGYLLYLCIYKARKTMAEKNLNRLKVVLAEKISQTNGCLSNLE